MIVHYWANKLDKLCLHAKISLAQQAWQGSSEDTYCYRRTLRTEEWWETMICTSRTWVPVLRSRTHQEICSNNRNKMEVKRKQRRDPAMVWLYYRALHKEDSGDIILRGGFQLKSQYGPSLPPSSLLKLTDICWQMGTVGESRLTGRKFERDSVDIEDVRHPIGKAF